MIRLLLIIPIVIFFIGCQKLETNKKGQNKNLGIEVIYGEDNRMDFYELNDDNWKDLAQSTVALFDKDDLVEKENGFEVQYETYGEYFNLCPNEPFYFQPTRAFCSGFLIGSDLVVTAGHCVRNELGCNHVRFAFGYHYTSLQADPIRLRKQDVYRCAEVIHSQANGVTGSDYALIRLDRNVTEQKPLLVRTQGTLSTDDELTVIGYPSGLPGKIAFEGLVRDTSKDTYVVTTLDTYGGNSGSAVLNSTTRLVEGILVRGDTDFAYDSALKCRRSNVCKEQECRGEDVVRISEVLNHLTPAF